MRVSRFALPFTYGQRVPGGLLTTTKYVNSLCAGTLTPVYTVYVTTLHFCKSKLLQGIRTNRERVHTS
jgi:hypothetical protein